MAHWTPVTTHPKKAGKYRVKCGVSQDTFWAIWSPRLKRWTNLTKDLIAFGDRDCGDTWRETTLKAPQAPRY